MYSPSTVILPFKRGMGFLIPWDRKYCLGLDPCRTFVHITRHWVFSNKSFLPLAIFTCCQFYVGNCSWQLLKARKNGWSCLQSRCWRQVKTKQVRGLNPRATPSKPKLAPIPCTQRDMPKVSQPYMQSWMLPNHRCQEPLLWPSQKKVRKREGCKWSRRLAELSLLLLLSLEGCCLGEGVAVPQTLDLPFPFSSQPALCLLTALGCSWCQQALSQLWDTKSLFLGEESP